MHKAGIYIDGRNFEIGALSVLQQTEFDNVLFLKNLDFSEFFQSFLGDRKLITANYYRGFPTSKNFSETLCRNVNEYLNFLSNAGISIYKGYYTQGNKEKGVDV